MSRLLQTDQIWNWKWKNSPQAGQVGICSYYFKFVQAIWLNDICIICFVDCMYLLNTCSVLLANGAHCPLPVPPSFPILESLKFFIAIIIIIIIQLFRRICPFFKSFRWKIFLKFFKTKAKRFFLRLIWLNSLEYIL